MKRIIFILSFLITCNALAEFRLSYSAKHLDFWIDYFTKRQRATFQRFIDNSQHYRESVESILKEHKLPTDLFYVALIESGFSLKVKSRAGARGPWQFMRATGKRYGLRVDSGVDERVNLHKATHAAAGYFKDLYNIFGSWELALCAYNAGEYKIIRAIRKGNTRDYRELVAKRLLPKETIYYIPKVVAAQKLFRSYSRYGFHMKKSHLSKLYEKAGARRVRGRFELAKLAKKWGVSLADMKRLNPDIFYRRVHARRQLDLYVPNAAIEVARVARIEQVPEVYRVKSGDTLIGISSRFDISLGDLINQNKIRKYRIYPGQELIIKKTAYIVRPGDSLHSIARKHRTSVAKLMELNSLPKSKIYPRQKLFLPARI